MSEPQPPQLPVEPGHPSGADETSRPQAPQPFGAPPAEPRVGGCGKPALIGCGVVFLLLGIAGITMVLNAKSLLVWFLDQAKPTILANAGADVTAEDRARFERAYAAAIAQVRAGKIDPVGLQAVQGQLGKAVEKPGVPRATFVALTEAFEKLGGVPPADAVPPDAKPSGPSEPAPQSAPPPPAAPPGAGNLPLPSAA